MKIGIVGGGAAGLMAAIIAAGCGADVTILEAGDRVGAKILATGNGKCNLSNTFMGSEMYRGAKRDFVQDALNRFGTKDTIAFFEDLGLMLRDKNGYLYPYCEQASAVLDILRYEVERLRVKVLCNFQVGDIRKSEKGFCVLSADKQQKQSFDKVIVTCGGKASVKPVIAGTGYDLAVKLGHRIVPVVPALTSLKCKETFFKSIAGVRAQGSVKLLLDGKKVLAQDRGEIQLTDYGISGIPVFQISRFAAYALREKKKIWAELDFLPDLNDADFTKMMQERLINKKEDTAEVFFTGILNKKVMQLFLKEAGIKNDEIMRNVSKEAFRKVLEFCKHFKAQVVDTGAFQNAQVCAGGVDTEEITPQMESKIHKGLYFAGEILDVDGICGGYNLQWAWTSGFLAGRNAAKSDAQEAESDRL